jgi:hypothetical protein
MKRLRTIPLRRLAPLALLLIAGLVGGCWNPFSPLIAPVNGVSTPPPAPSSAPGVLRLFEWCYNNKASAEYREIFSDDYRFFFSPVDSAGADYRSTPWTREDELISTTQLFEGGSTEAAATSISLTLDKNFFVFPDPRYVATDLRGRWHKNIRTQVVLNIRTSDGNAIDISGAANFYFVRGDSALIPEELRLRGFGPDSTRWYIQRWDDETAQAGPGGTIASLPARRSPARFSTTLDLVASWGAVKSFYRLQALAAGH